MDEVGFALSDGGDYKIIARKGSKRANLITSVDRTHITIAFSTNANGYCLEPCFNPYKPYWLQGLKGDQIPTV